MKFTFKITEVNREFLVRAPYAALDGNLTIIINQSTFFSKEGLSLLDLALSIVTWMSKSEAGILADFDYSSDEYAENPVLHLTKIDKQHYTIHSAWVAHYADNVLSLGEITRCFSVFLHELDAAIQQDYGVSFADIPLFNLVTKNS